jgi:hypothetical protein
VNDLRGPSVDSRTSDRKAKVAERLAHRGCNTRKGAIKVVIAWPERLYVVAPTPLTGGWSTRGPRDGGPLSDQEGHRTGCWTGSPDWCQDYR